MTDSRDTCTILLVEDSPDDVNIMQRAFRKARLRNPVVHCDTGDQALDFLYRRGEFAESETVPRPGLILLDLNLPGTDGHEVLRTLKCDPSLSGIPIVVLTTSADPVDIERCYASGANSYVQKPVGVSGFVQAVTKINDYWFELVILPDSAPAA